mmetsp:Transcript_53810/g.107096  ORF Transcript_53810/g.107096 Transcript_53810/m.107096 type:complete len:203 (-) Transcript_53810:1875-2483(-)
MIRSSSEYRGAVASGSPAKNLPTGTKSCVQMPFRKKNSLEVAQPQAGDLSICARQRWPGWAQMQLPHLFGTTPVPRQTGSLSTLPQKATQLLLGSVPNTPAPLWTRSSAKCVQVGHIDRSPGHRTEECSGGRSMLAWVRWHGPASHRVQPGDHTQRHLHLLQESRHLQALDSKWTTRFATWCYALRSHGSQWNLPANLQSRL